jgi:hypothetical protein
MVMALHTAGDLLHFHPHIHSLALDGGRDKIGTFHPLQELDTAELESLFAENVFQALREENLITDETIENMRSWEHSGFSVFSAEPVAGDDRDARLFLARYLKKCPLSLSRMSLLQRDGHSLVQYRRKLDDAEDIREFPPLEFLAELSVHVPNTWEQTTRFYGCYAARTRGNERAAAVGLRPVGRNSPPPFSPQDLLEPKRPASRHWATWIKKVYEVDPLSCPKCGEPMKVKAFLHDSREIKRLTKNLRIHAWRAPPPLGHSTSEPTCEPGFEQLLLPD